MQRSLLLSALVLLFVTLASMPAKAQGVVTDEPVEAGRFDTGRMFTLDEPPLDYFQETYNFAPDAAWFERAQLGALRFATYCSASFVSPDGLILTNHHCARQSVTQASVEDGVDYNEDGFYARDEDEEKIIDGLFVDQLVEIIDVTSEVDAAADAAQGNEARQQARSQAINAIQARMTDERGGEDSDLRVQVVMLYSGGQYKAYVYRRYSNIQLAFVPETAAGYFGGDPDNFTYPRYSLDFALFRAVDEDGDPLEVEHYFPFDVEGSDPGELVFVLGNPGSTTRLQTVAELEFRRDFTEPALLNAIASREEAYAAFLEANPDDPNVPELTDTYFSLGNSRKAYTGRVEGLRDPYILARRRAAERDFQTALGERADLQEEYGDLVDAIAQNRAGARGEGALYGAFVGFGPGSILSSSLMQRAILAAQYAAAPEGEARMQLRENILGVEDAPVALQQELVAVRLSDFERYLGANHMAVQAILQGRSPADAARDLVSRSALSTAAGTERLLESGDVASDPAVQAVGAVLPTVAEYQQNSSASNAELAELGARLARARFALFGTSIPPDATLTLRMADGVVSGFPYNGTVAPPYTTTYGLYDHYYSYCVAGKMGMMDKPCDWDLPQRWLEAEDDIDLSTPFNLVSTNDIIGGNSGSPLLDRDLQVVGIIFDGNIDSLPGNYIYLDEKNRAVSVDVRIMLEALDEVYEMDRLVDELRGE